MDRDDLLTRLATRSAAPEAVRLAELRLRESRPRDAEILADPVVADRFVTVTAASRSLTRLLLTERAALGVLADLGHREEPEAVCDREHLARFVRLEMLRIATRDLSGLDDLEATTGGLSRLAEDVLGVACRLALVTGDLAIIAMGKLGAGELNYASDIDLVFVVSEPADRLLGQVRHILESVRLSYRVDIDLRPEGRSGPLLRSLDSYRTYWDRWAEPWEFQALLKARYVAGDAELGARFTAEAADRLWSRRLDADDLAGLRAMKARSEELVAGRDLESRELKRGRGGIRDVEFAVQLLQLVHGRRDLGLRVQATLPALAELGNAGYVSTRDSSHLSLSYRFLRVVEHRLQLLEENQVHTVPKDRAARAHLAAVLGYTSTPEANALDRLDRALARHRSVTRSIHERLFFRPLLESFTAPRGDAAPLAYSGSPRGPRVALASNSERAPRPGGGDRGTEARATRQALTGRGPAGTTGTAGITETPGIPEPAGGALLASFGFREATRTAEALSELTRGITRSSRLMVQYLPLLLEWLGSSPDPDLGLLGLRNLAAGGHRRDLLIAALRESGETARRLCLLLGTSRRLGDLLGRHPEMLAEIGEDAALRRRSRDELAASLPALTPGGTSASTRMLRRFIERETLRIAASDVLGLSDLGETTTRLFDLAAVVLQSALSVVAPPVPFGIVALGRFGGAELAYGSDLDLLFVHGGSARDSAAADSSAQQLLELCNGHSPADRLLHVDLALRPEGRHGPIVRSLQAYASYYDSWIQTWERQALLRVRPLTGDAEVLAGFVDLADAAAFAPPFGSEERREIRRIKARIETERIPFGEDGEFHLKLGRGSLSDVEWTVQLLQLTHRVREPGTIAALTALRATGAIGRSDAEVLAEAYQYCERTRNRWHLVSNHLAGVSSKGRTDSLPQSPVQLTALARSLSTTPSELRETYRRVTRRSRRVVDRLFFGIGGDLDPKG